MGLDSLNGWRKTHYTTEIEPKFDGKEICLFGWVQEIRDLGAIKFIILQDRKGTAQITIPRKKTSKKILEKADSLQTQYCIGVKGIVKKTEMTPRGFEVIPTSIKVLGVAQHPLPLDVTGKTPATIDTRLKARVLDLCQMENRALWSIQHVVLAAIRKFLSERGFLEVYTPRIIATATEGGAALFAINYFDREAYLAQSPQLYKEELTLCFEKVFEIGPFFRAEESHTRRHLSEFISIDIEQAFATSDDVMTLLEQLTLSFCEAVNQTCKRELKTLNHTLDIPAIPTKRFTYTAILDELNEEGIEIPWGEDIPTPACRILGKLHPHFYFISEWPTKSKPFYIKPKESTPEVSEGFDFMWKWMELASGGTRVHSKDLLIKRLKEQNLNPQSFKNHLQAFNYGLPPHAGWAAGLERVMMMLTGKRNIREVVLFPRDRSRLTP
ncbi:MAG: aspartate--tRNA(Asn) ligase [Candidatus Bathyarchaeota archaeon]|nr:MAG: aspartate--tRNA(Asn) ligase [Candidatus Bathyarchaeota archaeon]